MDRDLAILVVDDDDAILALLQDLLSSDYQVFTADNCIDATDLLTAHRFSLLIIDLVLPVLDGAEFSRLLRADPEFDGLPLLVITGYPPQASALASVRIERTLFKPFTLDDVVQSVKQLTQSPSLHSRDRPGRRTSDTDAQPRDRPPKIPYD